MVVLISKEEAYEAIKETCEKYNVSFGDEAGGFGEAIAKCLDNISYCQFLYSKKFDMFPK